MFNARLWKQLPHFELSVEFQLGADILVLFGPSGSGKTTVLNMLAGLQRPDRGEIVCKGRTYFSDKQRINVRPQERNMGYVYQDYALFPHLNIKKNILFGVHCRQRPHPPEYQHIVEMLRIAYLERSYPAQLSGGEKQRAALARALMTGPDVLLLDEPFSALDTGLRRVCREELLQLHRTWNIPMIMVTHDLEEAREMGDSILFLDQGAVIRKESGRRSKRQGLGG